MCALPAGGPAQRGQAWCLPYFVSFTIRTFAACDCTLPLRRLMRAAACRLPHSASLTRILVVRAPVRYGPPTSRRYRAARAIARL